MTEVSTDVVLDRLSIKYNRIFCDREFVDNVRIDLRSIIKKTDKCCVLIFPALSPTYHRVVRYQGYLSDLATFTLGRAKTLAVCHKKFVMGESPSKEPEVVNSRPMAEQCCSRKKRPAMQLYVPPGRRSSDRPSSSDKRSQKDREKRHSESRSIESSDTTTSNEDLSVIPNCTELTEPRLPSPQCDTDCANTKETQDVNEPEVIQEEPKSDSTLIECLKEMNVVEDKIPSEKPEVTRFPQDKENAEQGRRKTDRVIVLDERREPPTIEPLPSTKDKIKSEHEEEKEIMRKAKENINKKTRKPLMKYVVDDDTLKINDVNNWEDLFDDEGELQDEIFAEIVQKVGPEVSIAKVTEDYSDYAAKQLEELEHMVELYDFPATLETNDIMGAFRELQNDSMYIKWVDDTHAILVLGSSSQARRALEMSNSLIKVRPMSAASRTALEKANQFDLKPAMKRPPTNLQTARRLITSHLGAKSKITKEQNEREKTDLKKAKELKRKALQAEKDAWEGNLRSNLD